MEVKIDKETLPIAGQKVKWQTQNDIDHERWKEGQFCSGDDLFCVGFEDSCSEWDLSWSVVHWIALD